MPKASIALATYNNERFLREQLDSLLAQTFQDFEIVVSDDGSEDGTVGILEAYAARDARLHWMASNRPRGISNNFTEAIARAKGDILFLCDGDDVWQPAKLERHMAEYDDLRTGWAYNEVELTDERLKPIGYLTDSMPDYYRATRTLRDYVWGSCILGCATSYRRTLLKGLLPPDPRAPGHDSWIQLAIYPARGAYIPEVLQSYRQHDTNAVGLLKEMTAEEHARREDQAIKDNFAYLSHLRRNRRLALWKRYYFTLVLVGKRLRALAFGIRCNERVRT